MHGELKLPGGFRRCFVRMQLVAPAALAGKLCVWPLSVTNADLTSTCSLFHPDVYFRCTAHTFVSQLLGRPVNVTRPCMNKALPTWALQSATHNDRAVAQAMHHQSNLRITWPNMNALRTWAKQHAWPTPWFRFKDAFLTHMLATDTNFTLAITNSGITVQFPKQHCTISDETLRELDTLYNNRSISGHPTGWDTLVEELRDIRRVIEAGITVHIEGEQPIQNWQQFYAWAHGRYYMLEDGANKWIGDDS